VLDVETKNLGTDIMKDNEQLLSLQLGDATKQELYYYDSKDSQWTLAMGKKRIESLLSQGVTYAGYNIKGFDSPILERFLGVEIPRSRIHELLETPRIVELHNRTKKWGMEYACLECGIVVTHKRKMDERAQKYKARQDIQERARVKAEDFVKNRRWTADFAYDKALDKIAGGHAIWDAYQEFIKRDGQKNTLFYEYAIGDVISEYQLLKKLGY
jgi:hypothetical protein